MEPTPAEPLDLLIHLEPSRADQPWRAVLVRLKTTERLEFGKPLELLQYLERLCRESGGRVTGIR